MPQTEVTTLDTPSSDVETTPEITDIGIEFEYPTGDGTPGYASCSNQLYDEVGYNPWPLADYIGDEVPTGEMTGDHVGAEITSDRLELHSDHPELWYAASIDRAEDMGYPFAATGLGDTVFGMHLHLSEIPKEKAVALYEMCQEPWMRVFVCSSLSDDSCDPWRHGGFSETHISGELDFNDYQHCVNPRRGNGHYEWRMPEPMQMDHFMMLMRFLRIFDLQGVEEARDYAENAVLNLDERLSAVSQYNYMASREEFDFPNDEMLTSDNRTTAKVARWFHNSMQGDDPDLLRE